MDVSRIRQLVTRLVIAAAPIALFLAAAAPRIRW